VQQCSACNTAIEIDAAAPLPQLCSFAQWLARHAGLVSSIYMRPLTVYEDEDTIYGLPFEEHLEAAQELLQLSMHAAAAQPETAERQQAPAAVQPSAEPVLDTQAVAGGSGAVCSLEVIQQQQQQQHCQQRGLRLCSFKSSLPRAVDMLAVLHPDSLTHVYLDLENITTSSTALSAALAGLSSLQQLRLFDVSDSSLWSALTALAQLSRLTSLNINGDWPWCWDEDLSWHVLEEPLPAALQQLLAHPLPLQRLKMHTFSSLTGRLPVLDMTLVTQLTKLDLIKFQLPKASVLPAQLQRLEFNAWGGPDSLAPVTRQQLKQLQHLSLVLHFAQQQPLLQLAQLPSLQHLALQYRAAAAGLAATVPAWGLLPQLQELAIAHEDWVSDNTGRILYRLVEEVRSKPQWAAILAGLAAATSLTKLQLEIRTLPQRRSHEPGTGINSDKDSSDSLSSEGKPVLAVCEHLAALTRLKDLTIRE
jgi:hypothetical protein